LGHFSGEDISFERAEAADAEFPFPQENFVVTGRQRVRKRPWSSVVNDVTSPVLFSTTKVAFASGNEPGASAFVGPG
jgi:hypothetical protein